jgi:hypothetical protein
MQLPTPGLGVKMTEKQKRGSWLSLVMLCVVTVLSAALGFGVLFAGASVVFAIVESPAVAEPRSVTNTPVSNSEAVQTASQPTQASPDQNNQNKDGKETENNDAASGKTFSGMVTDSHCGARHSRNSDKTSAECARLCVRTKGSHYVLVDGEEIHGLQGDRTQLDRLAGMRVDVAGKLVGDTIKVQSITPHQD